MLFADIDAIKQAAGDEFAEGIRRLRGGDVSITSGYDGEFGRIKVFNA